MSTLPDDTNPDDSSYTDEDWYRETQNTVCPQQDTEVLVMYKERQTKLMKRCPSIIDTWNWHTKTRADIQKYTLLYVLSMAIRPFLEIAHLCGLILEAQSLLILDLSAINRSFYMNGILQE